MEMIELAGQERERPMRGPWAACPECEELIRADRRADLAERAAAQTGNPLELIEAIHRATGCTGSR